MKNNIKTRIEKIGTWIASITGIFAILFLIFLYIDLKIENSSQEITIATLQSNIEVLKEQINKINEEHKNIKSDYRTLLVNLIMDKKVILNDFKSILPEDEFNIISKIELPDIPLPINLTNYYVPSGWMGDGEKGEKYLKYIEENNFLKFVYIPQTWAGIYWQYPNNNWGDSPGYNLSGARFVKFKAKGEKGGEKIQFKCGGIFGGKYQDSFVALLDTTLTDKWSDYSIDISQMDLSNVIGGFAWIVKKKDDSQKIIFYLKDINYSRK